MAPNFSVVFVNDQEQIAHFEHDHPDLGRRKVFIGMWDVTTQEGFYIDQLGDKEEVSGARRTLPDAAYSDWVAGCAYTANMWLAEGPPEAGYRTVAGMRIIEGWEQARRDSYLS